MSEIEDAVHQHLSNIRNSLSELQKLVQGDEAQAHISQLIDQHDMLSQHMGVAVTDRLRPN